MGSNKTLTGPQQNIRCHIHGPRYSQHSGRDDLDVPVPSKQNNCCFHLFLLYVVLVISFVITVGVIYMYKSLTLAEKVDQRYSEGMNYSNSSQSLLNCNFVTPLQEDWYHPSRNSPVYYCEPFQTVSNINIQPLQVRGHECNDTDHCYDMIHAYLDIMEEHSRFAFFVDNDANVYGGRGWRCQFWKGQIWVAVMVEGFGAASQTEKERILRHFKEGVIPREKYCSVNESDLQFNYYDKTAI